MSSDRASRRFGDQTGAVLITGLLLAFAVLLVIGAAVDIGRAFIARRELVSLADDAALSASQELDEPALHDGRLRLDPDRARATALRTFASEPAVSGQATSTPAHVTVTVDRRLDTVLLKLAGLSTLEVAARATASPRAP